MDTSIKVTGFFIITFLIGVFVGYVLNRPISRIVEGKQSVEQVEQQHADRHDDGQTEGRFDENRARQFLIDQLNLTEEQQTDFFRLTSESRREMRSIMQSSREETNRKIRIQVDSLNAKLSEILTEDQMEAWMRMNRRYERTRNQGPGAGMGPMRR